MRRHVIDGGAAETLLLLPPLLPQIHKSLPRNKMQCTYPCSTVCVFSATPALFLLTSQHHLCLGKLGMVSPAMTPDLAALRRGEPLAIVPATNRQQEEEDNDSLTSFTRRDLEENESLSSLTRREQEDKTSLASYGRREQTEDNSSMASFTSHQTLPDDSSLPSYSQAMSRKKKIIPVVQSEPESSPSPEQSPSSPISSPRPAISSTTVGSSISARFRQSQALEPTDLGNKLKNSFSKNLLIGCSLRLIFHFRIERQERKGG